MTRSNPNATEYRAHLERKAVQLQERGMGHIHGGTVAHVNGDDVRHTNARHWLLSRILVGKGHRVWTPDALHEFYKLRKLSDDDLAKLDPDPLKKRTTLVYDSAEPFGAWKALAAQQGVAGGE